MATTSETAYLLDKKEESRKKILNGMRLGLVTVFGEVRSGAITPEEGKSRVSELVSRTMNNLQSLAENTSTAISGERVHLEEDTVTPSFDTLERIGEILEKVFPTADKTVGDDTPVSGPVADILEKWVQLRGSGTLTPSERDELGREINRSRHRPNGPLYRGADYPGDLSDLRPGQPVDIGPSSTSEDLGSAEAYAHGVSGTPILFEFRDARGLRVSDRAEQSAGYGEQEWIVSGRFYVSRVKKDDDITIVVLRSTLGRTDAEQRRASSTPINMEEFRDDPLPAGPDPRNKFLGEIDALQEEVASEAEEVEAEVLELRQKKAPEKIVGYRRVPHPELSEGGTCGLCVLASEQVYKRARLKNLHPGCKCTVVEVTATSDPGGALNNLELGELYSMIGGTDGHDAHKVRFRRDSDGNLVRYADPKQRLPENDPDEVGRRRRAERDKRRTPDDLARRIEVLEREIVAYERRLARGEDVALELKAVRDQLARLRRQSA